MRAAGREESRYGPRSGALGPREPYRSGTAPPGQAAAQPTEAGTPDAPGALPVKPKDVVVPDGRAPL
ncbi:hypothetical protein GCM10010140_08590 [Streptosporangium pseudovulgare]|uniref:Uncharacterized protein n=1 Tax=Streptosporangium pseudovulgare TaxID=35765 RepID=A0ABQ2QJB8_9ACTN|nr:hypothetical protein GCM10010140_08590 [Streptosporangium pseudovulgare]